MILKYCHNGKIFFQGPLKHTSAQLNKNPHKSLEISFYPYILWLKVVFLDTILGSRWHGNIYDFKLCLQKKIFCFFLQKAQSLSEIFFAHFQQSVGVIFMSMWWREWTTKALQKREELSYNL